MSMGKDGDDRHSVSDSGTLIDIHCNLQSREFGLRSDLYTITCITHEAFEVQNRTQANSMSSKLECQLLMKSEEADRECAVWFQLAHLASG